MTALALSAMRAVRLVSPLSRAAARLRSLVCLAVASMTRGYPGRERT
ncbi:MAG TPA: hypothetical protein VHQ97_04230 [Solirubrobacterales bacterium]|jgi:hypothetical protein|nr:hypothetical protein [Solirubrobacterales bacterium]